jgi:hypothetical protein
MSNLVAAPKVTTERASAEGRCRGGRAAIDATQPDDVLALPARLRGAQGRERAEGVTHA